MPLPVLFPKLYLQLTIEGRTTERSFTNVKSLAWWVRKFTSGTYRDQPQVNFGKTVPELGKVYAADIPIIGGDVPLVASETTANAVAKTRFVIPDDAAHIPPRPMPNEEGGLLIGLTDAELPTPPEPPFASMAFTINVASNICTTATAMPFAHGDLVAIAATTAPAAVTTTPFSVSTPCSLVKLSTTTFLLRNSAGQIIDFNNAGAGCVAALVTGARLPPPVPTGFFFYREAWQPRLFVDPALTSQVTLP